MSQVLRASCLAGLLALAAPAALAQACPDPARLKNICMAVSERIVEKDPAAQHKYRYRTQIMRAACVDPADSPAAMKAKVDRMWRENQSRLICNSLQFDIQNGSLLKFAINQYFDAFLDDAIELGVPLDLVDASDGKTVLDYVQDKMERNRGKETAKTLEAYHWRLRKAGAKYRSEL